MNNFKGLVLLFIMILLVINIFSINIAVLSFNNDTGMMYQPYYNYGDYIADELEEQLIKYQYLVNNNLNIISRMDLGYVLHEQNLDLSGRFNTDDIMELGEISGVKYIIIGSITSIQTATDPFPPVSWVHSFDVEARIKIINTTTGRIIYSDSFEGSNYERVSIYTNIGPQFFINNIKISLRQIVQYETVQKILMEMKEE